MGCIALRYSRGPKREERQKIKDALLIFLSAGFTLGVRQNPDGADTKAIPLADWLARGQDKSPFLALIHKRDGHLAYELVGLGAHDELQAVHLLDKIGRAHLIYAEAQGDIAAAGGIEIDADRSPASLFG